MTLIAIEKSLATLTKVRFDLDQNKISGIIKSLYIGHTTVDIDEAGLEPTEGFQIETSLIKSMKNTAEKIKPGIIVTTSWIEFKNIDLEISGHGEDFISIRNADARAYRYLIKMEVHKGEK